MCSVIRLGPGRRKTRCFVSPWDRNKTNHWCVAHIGECYADYLDVKLLYESQSTSFSIWGFARRSLVSVIRHNISNKTYEQSFLLEFLHPYREERFYHKRKENKAFKTDNRNWHNEMTDMFVRQRRRRQMTTRPIPESATKEIRARRVVKFTVF
jgi:hypothetical protein